MLLLLTLNAYMQIRRALIEDAEEACLVVRRSIEELCHADHKGNAASLAGWLANKTPANMATWISHPGSHVVVAVDEAAILGVAAMTSAGEITLNNVSQSAGYGGVRKALIGHLEVKAR